MARRRRPKPSADRILAAAEALFAERGYGGASLRDLIAAAGCSTTAFYARFPDKDSVLAALVDDLLGSLAEAAAEALPAARSVEEGFARGVDLLCATVAARKGLVRVALGEGNAVPAVRDVLRSAYARLAALLGAGLAPRADAAALGWALVGAMDVHVRRWAVFGDLADDALPGALRDTAAAMMPA